IEGGGGLLERERPDPRLARGRARGDRSRVRARDRAPIRPRPTRVRLLATAHRVEPVRLPRLRRRRWSLRAPATEPTRDAVRLRLRKLRAAQDGRRAFSSGRRARDPDLARDRYSMDGLRLCIRRRWTARPRNVLGMDDARIRGMSDVRFRSPPVEANRREIV